MSLIQIGLLIQLLVYGTALGIIIYLIIKRYKKKEDFEKRDN